MAPAQLAVAVASRLGWWLWLRTRGLGRAPVFRCCSDTAPWGEDVTGECGAGDTPKPHRICQARPDPLPPAVLGKSRRWGHVPTARWHLAACPRGTPAQPHPGATHNQLTPTLLPPQPLSLSLVHPPQPRATRGPASPPLSPRAEEDHDHDMLHHPRHHLGCQHWEHLRLRPQPAALQVTGRTAGGWQSGSPVPPPHPGSGFGPRRG